MEVKNITTLQLNSENEDERYSQLLKLAPVLLRAQNSRVVAELVVSALSDYLPGLSFIGLLMADDNTGYRKLVALLQGRMLRSNEAAELLQTLPAVLFDRPASPAENKSRVYQTDNRLHKLLKVPTLQLFPMRTPIREFGLLITGYSSAISDTYQKYLQALAELTAIALDNAMRFDDLKEAAHEMGLVNEMAGSLAASLNGEELFNSFMSHLQQIVPVDRASLALLDPLGKTFSLAFIWNNPPGQSTRIYYKDLVLTGSPLEDALSHQEIITGQWNWNPKGMLQDHQIFSELFDSHMVIPLVAKKQLVGAITLAVHNPDYYQNEVLRRSLLEKLAALFALALLNSRLYEEKQLSAEYDSRVGVFNHDYFDRELALQMHKASRNDYNLGLMMVDLDNLKTVNDRYGHLAGDAALRHIASLISGTVRSSDVVSRYGGDEFGVLLPYCSHLGLEKIAEKTRRTIRSTPLQLENGVEVNLTVSIGAVISPDDGHTPRDLIQNADAAMYVAKRTRDQVCIGANARQTYFADSDPLSVEQVQSFIDAISANEHGSDNYERIQSILGNNRNDIENRLIQELNQKLTETRQKLEAGQQDAQKWQAGLFMGLKELTVVIEQREPYLKGFSDNTARLTGLLAGRLQLDKEKTDTLELAAHFLNLGRVGVPEPIWQQAGQLSPQDWQLVRGVPLQSLNLIKHFQPVLQPGLLEAVLYQRECYNGSGYPHGLAGEEIPLLARLVGICSAVAAMAQPRPFRPPTGLKSCRRQLELGAGRQFDSQLAAVFISLLDEGALEFLDLASV